MQFDQRVSRYVDDGNKYERLVQMFGQVAVEALANGLSCTIRGVDTDRGKILQFFFEYHRGPNTVFRDAAMFSMDAVLQSRDITSDIQACKDVIRRLIDDINRQPNTLRSFLTTTPEV